MNYLPMILGVAGCVCCLTNPIVRNSESMAVAGEATAPSSPDWVRGKSNLLQPAWGLRGGLLFSLHPGGPSKTSGLPAKETGAVTSPAAHNETAPRGLIRLFFPVLDGGKYDLINFIAVEPVVAGRRGLSELELSRLDGVPGKRIWASGDIQPPRPVEPGKLTRPLPGVEQLAVVLRVERFENGAHVYLVVTQHGNAPDEIQLAVHAEPDSAPLQCCVLTATMGNKARTRLLWLNGEVISSLRLYPNYHGFDFAPIEHVFPLARLFRTAERGVLVAVTTDERDPAAVFPFPGTRLWYYGGTKVTQYWRKPKGTFRDDLSAAVSARYVYWKSKQPIPGGIAYENFEMREPFSEGQSFVFGITRRTPAELGFRAADPQGNAAK